MKLKIVEENGSQVLQRVKDYGKTLLDRVIPQGERDVAAIMADEIVNTPGRLIQSIPDPSIFTQEERQRLMIAAAGYAGQSKTPKVPEDNKIDPLPKGFLINKFLDKRSQEAESRMGSLASTLTRLATPIPAFHGTKFKFTRFDSNFRKTGEGSNYRGAGHYIAENKTVAERYGYLVGGDSGVLLDVNFKGNRDDLLDLDEVLSNQPKKVKDSLNKIDDDVWDSLNDLREQYDLIPIEKLDPDVTGWELYSSMERLAQEGPVFPLKSDPISDDAAEEVSKYLSELGILGNRFLDAKSRELRNFSDKYLPGVIERNDLTRNMVIFDDKNLEVLKKD